MSTRPGFDSLFRSGFSPRSSHTSDFKTGSSAAALLGAWCNGVSAGTGWPGVNILRVAKIGYLICNFLLSAVPEIHKQVAGAASNRQTAASSSLQQPTNNNNNIITTTTTTTTTNNNNNNNNNNNVWSLSLVMHTICALTYPGSMQSVQQEGDQCTCCTA